MAGKLTNKGMETLLLGTVTPNGSIANLATSVRLYTSASTPLEDGTGFTQVANGNGYLTGGIAIVRADWTYAFASPVGSIRLADKTWTASGGNIANVAGAYIVNGANEVLAWWDKTPAVTQAPPDQIIADDLTLAISN